MLPKLNSQHLQIITRLRIRPVVNVMEMSKSESSLTRWWQLENAGILVRKHEDPRDVYPDCVFEINEQKLAEVNP